MNALHRIYKNLNDGYSYGYDYMNAKYPFFNTVLYKPYFHDCIGFSHYGSSACDNTLSGLEWILTHIFEMSPEQFEITYILNTESEIEE